MLEYEVGKHFLFEGIILKVVKSTSSKERCHYCYLEYRDCTEYPCTPQTRTDNNYVRFQQLSEKELCSIAAKQLKLKAQANAQIVMKYVVYCPICEKRNERTNKLPEIKCENCGAWIEVSYDKDIRV